MKRHNRCVFAFAVGMTILWTATAAAEDLMLGVSPADGLTMLAKQFPVSAGTTIEGVEFSNNDPRTVFPELLLARNVGTALSEGVVVARVENVRESSAGLVRVLWAEPVRVAEASTYYVALRVPAGQVKDGPGRGPGVGAVATQSTNGSFIGGGTDGSLNAIRADLSLVLITSSAGKAVPEQPAPDRASELTLSSSNPSHGSVIIRFGVDRPMEVDLEVYNIAGQRIRTLFAGSVPTGISSREWDGRDEHGSEVATGVYIAKLRARDKTLTQKLVLTK